MRDLGVGEIGIFRRRPNAQCQSWAVGRLRARPPTWRLRGGLSGGLHGGEGSGGGGDGRRGVLPCALVSGSKAEAATA